jgi:hypothetical protein
LDKKRTGFIGFSFVRGCSRGKNTMGIDEALLKGATNIQCISAGVDFGWDFIGTSSGKFMFRQR